MKACRSPVIKQKQIADFRSLAGPHACLASPGEVTCAPEEGRFANWLASWKAVDTTRRLSGLLRIRELIPSDYLDANREKGDVLFLSCFPESRAVHPRGPSNKSDAESLMRVLHLNSMLRGVYLQLCRSYAVAN